MDLKEFLQSKFDKKSFLDFLQKRFHGFELNYTDGDFLGKVRLDDKKELGFFIFKVDDNIDIENNRKALSDKAKKAMDIEQLDGAIAAFYNFKSAWRLTFVRYAYDDNHKKIINNQKRFTFILGNPKIKTAEMQLKNLKYSKLNEIEKVFSVEAVTKEFYKGLIVEYNKLTSDYLIYPSGNDKDKKEFAIRLVGRLLFVRFLNKKQLVPDEVFNIKKDYYHEILEPLFFEQLNTPQRDSNGKNVRKSQFINDSIPFLNGGLFEPLHLDYYEFDGITSRYIGQLNIRDEFFVELYEHFDKFNFTIDENSLEDSDLSIDPEMLGRIFENLLAEINEDTKESARKSTGSYYTPREIVEYMVNSSIFEYLKTKTSADEAKLKTLIFNNQNGFEAKEKNSILGAIYELKILDPACGSGAFPMGLLNKIVLILDTIDIDGNLWFNLQSKEFKTKHKDRDKNYIRKLSIIHNSIYGVDIQPVAIEISKLRFFLSLMVDENPDDSRENRGIEPLPNLEFKFVCANTLLPLHKEFDKDGLFMGHSEKDTKATTAATKYYELEKELIKLKNEYFEANGDRKVEIREGYKKIRELMFKEESSFNLESALFNKLTDYDPFNPVSVAGFFDMDFMFNIKDGFDVVIGNPPYLGEKGHKDIFEPLKKLKYYQGKMDLFYFFFHIGIDNLKDSGILSLITTNYYITATGAVKLRNDFKERTTVLNLINFNELKIFESALGQHNLITTLQKGKFDKLANTCVVNAKGYMGTEILKTIVEGRNKDTNYYKVPQDKLFSGGNIQLTIGGIDDILDKILTMGVSLGEICEINQGILSGADTLTDKHIENFGKLGKKGDGIFVLDLENPRDLDIFNSIPQNEKDILKSFYKNSDIKKYVGVADNTKFIIYITKQTDISKYPTVLKHLERFKLILQEKRETKEGKLPWHCLYWARDDEIFEAEKISCPRRSKQNIFMFEQNKYFEQSDIMIITQPQDGYSLKLLLAILNSKLIYKWLYYRGKRKGEMLELYQEPLSKIPIIKNVEISTQDIIVKIVDYIIFLKQQDFYKSDDLKFAKDRLMVAFFERLIDAIVYELYFPNELHKENKYFVSILENEKLVEIENMGNKLEDIRQLAERFSDKNHAIKKNLFFIDSVEIVRVIEGKENANYQD